MERVMITGATGFIGSHIARAFCRNNVDLGCLVRKTSNLSPLKGLNVELRYGDIRDKESLVCAFDGYTCVIHNAAFVRDWGRYRNFHETNVKGTLNVMAACLQNRIGQILMTGSNAVYGEENCTKIKDENSPINPHYRYFLDRLFPCKLNYYRDTKAKATVLASRFAERSGLNLTILDPVWVYGEREFHTGFYEYLKSVREGTPFLPSSKTNRFHVIYAGDLAEAYYLAFQKKLKGIHRFLIGNQRAESMYKIYELFCKKAGLKMPPGLPKALFYPIGFLMEILYTSLGSPNPPLLTRGRVNLFYDSIEYSVARARELLGFVNRHTLEEGIARTVAWYKQRKLL